MIFVSFQIFCVQKYILGRHFQRYPFKCGIRSRWLTFLYTPCISKIAKKKISKRFGKPHGKVYLCSSFHEKTINIAAMQKKIFNILGGRDIQSAWRLGCDAYMHTPSIVAPRYSESKTMNNLLTLDKAQTSLFWSHFIATFHIARGGSRLLLT